MSDAINPDYYQKGDMQCFDVWVALGIAEPACVAMVYKYLWRFDDKNGLEDLKKAQWYLNRLIQLKEQAISDDKAKETHEEYFSETSGSLKGDNGTLSRLVAKRIREEILRADVQRLKEFKEQAEIKSKNDLPIWFRDREFQGFYGINECSSTDG